MVPPMFSCQPLPHDLGDLDAVDFQLLTEYLMEDGAKEGEGGLPSENSDESAPPSAFAPGAHTPECALRGNAERDCPQIQ
jgi:hypothetical protein